MAHKIYIFLLAAFLTSTKGAPTCEDGWVTYKDELCVKTFSDLRTYVDAKEFCLSLGDETSKASLVMVKEPDLQDLLANYTHSTFDYIWLGSRYDNESSQFKWEDGEALTYTNWQDGYPHNISDADACIELRPTDLKSFKNAEGKWAHVTCQKRNLVMCQKDLSWSISDAVNEIIRVRKQHEEDMALLQEEIVKANNEITKQKDELASVNSRVVPVGSIYIEYYNQPSPQTLWASLTWEDITSTYAGLFFRVSGGDSAAWGVTQDACSPRVTQVEYHWMVSSEHYPYKITLPVSGWSPIGYAGDNEGETHREGLRYYTENCEIRPTNQAIRVWKRTT